MGISFEVRKFEDGKRRESSEGEIPERKLPGENQAEEIKQPKENTLEEPEKAEQDMPYFEDLPKEEFGELHVLRLRKSEQDQQGIDAAREKLENIKIPDPKVVEAVQNSESIEWLISNILGNNVEITSSNGQKFSSRQMAALINEVVYGNEGVAKISNAEPYKLRDVVINLINKGAYRKERMAA